MSFKDSIEKIENKNNGLIVVWNRSTGWHIHENDLDNFCQHMDNWHSIPHSLSRKEYENLCKKFSIKPALDEDIGNYGDCFGDFGMGHYHTEPKNRKTAIEASLRQARWREIKIERPNIEAERQEQKCIEGEKRRLKELRKTYPKDLQKWINDVGGIEEIYQSCEKIHSNNSHQLREEGRHFEWLISHSCLKLGHSKSKNHPEYIEPKTIWDKGNYPLVPEWWADWDETDPEHPINKISEMLKDRRIEPYTGELKFYGYGEDCGDDVRKNLKDWLGN